MYKIKTKNAPPPRGGVPAGGGGGILTNRLGGWIFLLLIGTSLLSCKNRQRDINLKAMLEDAQELDYAAEMRLYEDIDLFKKIENTIADRGNKAEEVAFLKKGVTVCNYCNKIFRYADDANHILIARLLNKTKEEIDDKEYSIEELLGSISQKIRLGSKSDSLYLLINEFKSLTGNSDPIYNTIQDQLDNNAYLSSQLLTLVALKLEALKEVRKQLLNLIYVVDERDLTYDNLSIEVVPETNIVEEGKNYNAQIRLITKENNSYLKSIKYDGKELAFDSNGVAKLSFIAKADKFDKDGVCRKMVKASIMVNFMQPDSTFVFEREYLVRKGCRK